MGVHELEQAQMSFMLMSRILCTYCVLAVAVAQAHLHNVHSDVNQGKRCMGCVTCRCGPSASRALSTNLLIGLRPLLVVPQLVSSIVKLPSTSAASVTCSDPYLTCVPMPTSRCRHGLAFPNPIQLARDEVASFRFSFQGTLRQQN